MLSPPGLCALLLKPLGSDVQLRLLLLSSLLPVSLSLSLCAVLPLTLLSQWLWLLLGTCAGSGFVIGVASLFLTPPISACSFVWRLFSSASVASDGLGDAVAIDKGGGGVSSSGGGMRGGGKDSGGDSVDKGNGDKDSVGSEGDGGNGRRGGDDAKLGRLEAGG